MRWKLPVLSSACFTVLSFALLGPTDAGAASDAQCNTGKYNFRQATKGACVWGNVEMDTPIFRPNKLIVNVVLMDNAKDGKCAHLDVDGFAGLSWHTTDNIKVCGSGKSKPVQKTYPFISADRLRFRVCSEKGSCSDWKTYAP